MDEKKTLLTQDGYNKLVEKLDYMKSVRRMEVSERLKTAIALGDLSENSEYDDAKNEQGRLESDISELEAKLRNSEIIHSAAGTGKVMIGSTVTIRDVELDDVETYMIVGSTEADPTNPVNKKISDESPLGAAILNKSAGEIVQVQAPAGVIEYELLDVK